MKQVIAAIVGLTVRNATHSWASRQALEPWAAHLLAFTAGTCASATILRL